MRGAAGEWTNVTGPASGGWVGPAHGGSRGAAVVERDSGEVREIASGRWVGQDDAASEALALAHEAARAIDALVSQGGEHG